MNRRTLQATVVLIVCIALGGLLWVQWQHLARSRSFDSEIRQAAQANTATRSAPPTTAPHQRFRPEDDRSADEQNFRDALATDVSNVVANAADHDQQSVNQQVQALCVDALPLLKSAIGQPAISPQAARRVSDALDTVPARLKLGIARQQMVQWYRANTLDILDRHAGAYPGKASRLCVAAMVRQRTQFPIVSNDEQMIMWYEGQNAVVAGEYDPLVLYIYGRNFLNYPSIPVRDAWVTLDEAQKRMERSDYPPSLKFSADMRAAQTLSLTGTSKPEDLKKIDHLLELANSHFPQILADPQVPREEWMALFGMIEQVSLSIRKDRRELAAPFFDQLTKSNVDKSTILTIQGIFNVDYAWDARGGGWASSVTDQGWELMRQRLLKAQNALEQAWQLDPTNYWAANEMIDVELGQGQGRDRMELWFNRAMDVYPDDYAACSAKLNYLEPKWFGSEQAMIDFGRQCLAQANWRARIPLVVVDAYDHAAHYGPNGWQQQIDPKYFQGNTAAWNDIAAAYDGCFKYGVPSKRIKLAYAKIAAMCGHWVEANRAYDEVGDWFDSNVFPTAKAWRDARNEAAQHAKAL
jgi:hypothetical protein